MCTLPVIYERNGLQLALSVEVFAYSLHSGLKHIFSNSCDVDYRRAISWSVHVGWEGLICLMDRSGLLLPFGCTIIQSFGQEIHCPLCICDLSFISLPCRLVFLIRESLSSQLAMVYFFQADVLLSDENAK